MKVNKSSRDVEVIQFRHSGMNLNYKIFIPAKYKKDSEAMIDFEILRIDFDDLEEVVSLMRMLENFFEEARLGIGKWERERSEE